MGSPVDVVVLYAPEDAMHHDDLVKHLEGLVEQRVIATWSSKEIAAGDDWQVVTRRHLHAARVLLLLLTADFFAADLDDLIAQAQRAGGHLVPVRVRAHDWGAAPLPNLRPLPASGTPVTLWADRDLAWAGVAEALRHLVTSGAAAPTTPARSTPFHVPFLRNPSFVGREDDLAGLHALLQKGAAVGVRPAALTGMGGIGKTQLAVEYAYRYAKAYPGGVYWVNAAQSVQAEFARLALAAGLTPGVTADAAKALCASVGCLPLALVLAAAFLARYPRIAVADYLKRIRNEGALAAGQARCTLEGFPLYTPGSSRALGLVPRTRRGGSWQLTRSPLTPVPFPPFRGEGGS